METVEFAMFLEIFSNRNDSQSSSIHNQGLLRGGLFLKELQKIRQGANFQHSYSYECLRDATYI